MPSILEALHASPVIAAVRSMEQLRRALETPVRVIFLLGGDPETLPGLTQLLIWVFQGWFLQESFRRKI